MNYLFYILIGLVAVWLGWWLAKRSLDSRLRGNDRGGGKGVVNKQSEEKQRNKERVLELFKRLDRVTNDDVEKMLKVSDATATNYLSELEGGG